LYNKRAVIDNLPSEDSGEYMTPDDPNERKLLLMREHLKGHFASDAIYYGLKRKGIYWANLKNEAIQLVKSCTPCQQFNIVKKGYNPLRPITASLPGDSWGIDLAGPFKTSIQGNNYLLIMVDIATRYCVLRPIPDKSSLSIVKEIVNLMVTFGIPRIIQSDNGTEFVNEMMSLLAEHSGFEHRLISAYHPRANGVSERWVQSSVNTIKKQVNGMSADWDLYVGPTQLFLNTKYNERTKTPPFTLMFGRNANDFEDFSKEKD
jgi:transposase InsO family protein